MFESFIFSVLLKLFDFILHVCKDLAQFSLEEESLLVLLTEIKGGWGGGVVYCLGAGEHPSETWEKKLAYFPTYLTSKTILDAHIRCARAERNYAHKTVVIKFIRGFWG